MSSVSVVAPLMFALVMLMGGKSFDQREPKAVVALNLTMSECENLAETLEPIHELNEKRKRHNTWPVKRTNFTCVPLLNQK